MNHIKLHYLDDAVNLADEPEAGEESDGAAEDEHKQDHDGAVSEVEHGADEASDSHLGLEIVDTVQHEVERGGAGGEEGAPPPVVVLGAQVEVAQQD